MRASPSGPPGHRPPVEMALLRRNGDITPVWVLDQIEGLVGELEDVVVDREWPIILTVVFVSSHHRSFPRTMELLTWNSQNHNSLLPAHHGLKEPLLRTLRRVKF